MKKKNLIIYFSLLIAFYVLSNYVVKYSFNILDYGILSSVFTFPFVYFFINRINKHKGPIVTAMVLGFAIAVQGIVFYILNNYTNTAISAEAMTASFISFIISAGVNILLYIILIKDHKYNYFVLLLIYMTVLTLDNIIFLSIFYQGFISGTEIQFLISNTFRIFVASIIVFVEYKLDKKDFQKIEG